MGVRQKPNVAYFNGCLLVSGLVGLAAQSWTLFGLAMVVMVVAGCHSGEIRHRPGSGAGRGR